MTFAKVYTGESRRLYGNNKGWQVVSVCGKHEAMYAQEVEMSLRSGGVADRRFLPMVIGPISSGGRCFFCGSNDWTAKGVSSWNSQI